MVPCEFDCIIYNSYHVHLRQCILIIVMHNWHNVQCTLHIVNLMNV